MHISFVFTCLLLSQCSRVDSSGGGSWILSSGTSAPSPWTLGRARPEVLGVVPPTFLSRAEAADRLSSGLLVRLEAQEPVCGAAVVTALRRAVSR